MPKKRVYVPGWNCKCGALFDGDCDCGADWTPVEVYQLREEVNQLQRTIAVQKAGIETRDRTIRRIERIFWIVRERVDESIRQLIDEHGLDLEMCPCTNKPDFRLIQKPRGVA